LTAARASKRETTRVVSGQTAVYHFVERIERFFMRLQQYPAFALARLVIDYAADITHLAPGYDS